MTERPTAPPSRFPALLLCVPLLVGSFLVAWVLPVPVTGNEPRERIVKQIEERMPGWEIETVAVGHEGSWFVAVRCGRDILSFQLLRDARPVGGLPWGDYWISPMDPESRDRLGRVSERIGGWLVWPEFPERQLTMPCESDR